ncbi:hypothetical protein ABZ631_04250 [Nocardiopsis alba]|uniref:hypothetical protein n=1 Tax=Nocardiopsis alba TaxID=53437 RepID=UPI0033FD62A7
MVLVAWVALVPVYPYPRVLVICLLVIFFVFSLMGARGAVFEGRYILQGEGLGVDLRGFLKSSLVSFSGVRVGMALVVSVSLHWLSWEGFIGQSLIFGLIFIAFFVIAGMPFSSDSKEKGV